MKNIGVRPLDQRVAAAIVCKAHVTLLRRWQMTWCLGYYCMACLNPESKGVHYGAVILGDLPEWLCDRVAGIGATCRLGGAWNDLRKLRL